MPEFEQVTPADRPHLRQTRFHPADDGLIERWVWEPEERAWHQKERRTQSEIDALCAQVASEQDEPHA